MRLFLLAKYLQLVLQEENKVLESRNLIHNL